MGASGISRLKKHIFFTKVNFNWEALKEKKMLSPLMPVLWDKVQYQKIDQLKIRPEYWMWQSKDERL